MSNRLNPLFSLAAVLVAAVTLSACSSNVTRTDGRKASVFQPSPEVPIGQVTITTSDQAKEELKDTQKFSTTQLKSAIENALRTEQMLGSQSGSGISMSVMVTHIRVRSTFSAVMWGAMAGNDSVEGDVTITDASGKVLDTFSVSTAYALGGFAGGQDKTRVGWLYDAFAEQVVQQFKPPVEPQAKRKKKA
jgi:hypothetical protein